MQPYFSTHRSTEDPARPSWPRSATPEAAAAQTSQLCMQDLQRRLQILPAAPPLCRAMGVSPRGGSLLAAHAPGHSTQAAQLLGTPSRVSGARTGFPSPPRRPCAPLPVCRRCFSHARRAVSARRTPSAVARRRAQLLGGPFVAVLVPGATVAARPPAPAARGRAGRRAVRPFLLAPTGYGCLPRLVPRTGLACPTSCKQAAMPQQLFKAAHPPASAAQPSSPRVCAVASPGCASFFCAFAGACWFRLSAGLWWPCHSSPSFAPRCVWLRRLGHWGRWCGSPRWLCALPRWWCLPVHGHSRPRCWCCPHWC